MTHIGHRWTCRVVITLFVAVLLPRTDSNAEADAKRFFEGEIAGVRVHKVVGDLVPNEQFSGNFTSQGRIQSVFVAGR